MNSAPPTRCRTSPSALRRWICLFLICAGAIESPLCRGAENFPDWLFPVAPAASNATPQDSMHRLSNRHSRLRYTQTELNDPFNAPDWFPESTMQCPMW